MPYFGNIEGDLSSERYNKVAKVFMAFSKRGLKTLDVFRNSLEKPHNTYNTQLVSSSKFESCYCIRSS